MNITAKQKLVLDAINENPRIANDDAALLSAVWIKEGFLSMYENTGLLYAIRMCTRPETISRRRRELYNMGLITYSDKALNERTEAFKTEQDNHSDYVEAFNQMFGTKDLLETFPKVKRTNKYEAVSWLDE